MIISAMFAFLHFVAVFGIFCTVFLEWQTMNPTPSYAEARRMQRCDLWYGIFAAIVLVVGFMRVYHFEKGHAFYSASPFYYVKLTLFLLVGLISIYPTVRLIKWRSHTSIGKAPVVSAQEYRRIINVLRTELILLLGVALSANLMARGVGV
jgi:putative membrane protein